MAKKYDEELDKIIYSNGAYKKLSKPMRNLILKHEKWRTSKSKTKNPDFISTLKDEERFLMDFHRNIFSVSRVVEQLKTIMFCFNHLPANGKLKNWDVKKADIKEYNYESFVHRIYTFRESVLQVINYMYHLNLSERNVNRNTVSEIFKPSFKFYDPEIKNLLDRIDTLFKPFNEKRRASVHFGKFSEFNLNILKAYEYLGKDISKLDQLKGREKGAQYLETSVFFRMFAIHNNILTIFKKLFNIVCKRGYLLYVFIANQRNPTK